MNEVVCPYCSASFIKEVVKDHLDRTIITFTQACSCGQEQFGSYKITFEYPASGKVSERIVFARSVEDAIDIFLEGFPNKNLRAFIKSVRRV